MDDMPKTTSAAMSLKNKLLYGIMGAAAAATSLLASSCASRCTGCLGCLSAGAGLAGAVCGAKIIHKIRDKDTHLRGERPPVEEAYPPKQETTTCSRQ